MKLLSEFERMTFGVFPTPLYKLNNLSRELGKNIYIKRDDMTGVGLGGNKVRKLEFLLADAKKKGADIVITTGGAQSNHAMLTAACAAGIGMKAVLVLKRRGLLTGGNLILDRIYGAEVHFVDTDTYDDVYAEINCRMEELKKEGHTPYFIPMGGSVPLGCLGYVGCVQEIARQSAELGVSFDSMISTVGSGGTYAGLTLGSKLFMRDVRSVGIGISDDPFEKITCDLMQETKELLESDIVIDKGDIHIRYHIGPGYGIPSLEGSDAVRRLARHEGILADPVYTGKALAGFFKLMREGYFAQDKNILFIHTGGSGALFAIDLLDTHL